MKKALIFGAGNIGRGFLGLELFNSGYSLSFTDVDRNVLEKIKVNSGYEVEIIESGEVKFVPVESVYHASEDLTAAIHDASLIVAAVGPNNLKHIAKALVPGLESYHRRDFKNIVACENMYRGSSKLKEMVLEHIGKVSDFVAFPDSVVDRISLPGEKVRVESFFEWVVDRKGWKGEADVACMKYVENIDAYVKRKLYLLNGSHATIGAMAQFKGIQYVHDALQDDDILRTVKGQMQEVNSVLVEHYGFSREEQDAYMRAVLQRFQNPQIKDETKRLLREPLRKLSREERLIAPALLSKNPDHLAKGIAYLMWWSHPEDQQSLELTEKIKAVGVDNALVECAQLDKYEHRGLIDKVARHFMDLM